MDSPHALADQLAERSGIPAGQLEMRTPAERALVLATLTQARLDGHLAAEVVASTVGSPAAHFQSVPVRSLEAMASTVQHLAGAVHAGRLDELTGLLVRSAGAPAITREIHRSQREHDRSPSAAPTSLAFLDVNNLKAVNDLLGHTAGDLLLLAVTNTLVSEVARRDTDLVVRWGGDEIVALLPGRTARQARAALNRAGAAAATRAVRDLTTHFGPTRGGAELADLSARVRRTGAFSMGVSEVRRGDDLTSVLGRADAAMYLDKESRRAERGGALALSPAMGTSTTAATRIRSGNGAQAQTGPHTATRSARRAAHVGDTVRHL